MSGCKGKLIEGIPSDESEEGKSPRYILEVKEEATKKNGNGIRGEFPLSEATGGSSSPELYNRHKMKERFQMNGATGSCCFRQWNRTKGKELGWSGSDSLRRLKGRWTCESSVEDLSRGQSMRNKKGGSKY